MRVPPFEEARTKSSFWPAIKRTSFFFFFPRFKRASEKNSVEIVEEARLKKGRKKGEEEGNSRFGVGIDVQKIRARGP